MSLLQDLRYAARLLLKDRWFTLIAATALALGMGTNAAVFTFVNAVLLRGLPFENPDRGLAGVPMGTLDVDPGYAVRAHIFVDSKAAWETIADGLPQHVEGLQSPKKV